MESIVVIFNMVYTCCTASYKAVSGLIEMLGFYKGQNLFILIFITRCIITGHAISSNKSSLSFSNASNNGGSLRKRNRSPTVSHLH